MFVLIVTQFATALLWLKALSRADGTNERPLVRVCVLLACIFNLHLMMFGFAPRLHRYFQMQEMFNVVKASMNRNIPQVMLQLTLIGLLLMNLASEPVGGDESDPLAEKMD